MRLTKRKSFSIYANRRIYPDYDGFSWLIDLSWYCYHHYQTEPVSSRFTIYDHSSEEFLYKKLICAEFLFLQNELINEVPLLSLSLLKALQLYSVSFKLSLLLVYQPDQLLLLTFPLFCHALQQVTSSNRLRRRFHWNKKDKNAVYFVPRWSQTVLMSFTHFRDNSG